MSCTTSYYRPCKCSRVVTTALVYCRCMECRLCVGWVAIRSAYFPGRFGCWSASWNHQGPWHSYKRANPRDESQLYGVQIPTDQIPSLAKGMEGTALEDIVERGKLIIKDYDKPYRKFISWLKLHTEHSEFIVLEEFTKWNLCTAHAVLWSHWILEHGYIKKDMNYIKNFCQLYFKL